MFYGMLLPFLAVGFGIYLYLRLIGTEQRAVIVAFVGGPLIKTFLIPFIKGIVTGALFKFFVRWLHGGKAKPA